MPKKRLKTIELPEWVDLEFRYVCPEDHRQQDEFYRAAAATAAQWWGPLAQRPGVNDGISHIDLAVLIGGHGMQILEASNYRAWTLARNLIHFQRALFLRSLVIGAGVLTADSLLQNPEQKRNWRPFHEPAGKFFGSKPPKRIESHIFISAMRMEQAVFHHLFPTALADNPDAMAGLALIDSFEAPGDKANPIVSSLRRATRKTLLKYQLDPGFVLSSWLSVWHPQLLNEVRSSNLNPHAGEEEILGESREANRALGHQRDQFAALVRDGLKAGTVKVSCAMAPFHGFRGHPLLVWPAGVDNLATQLQARPERAQEWFAEAGWVETDGEGAVETDQLCFVKGDGANRKKAASVTVTPLTSAGIRDLLDDEHIPDNPALALESELEAQGG